MTLLRRNFLGALRRVFPGCVAQSQAVAFNMFLALFPMMLLLLGLVASSDGLRGGLLVIIGRLRTVLPPGAEQMFLTFFQRRQAHAWQWISLGLGGTLLAGTQMMRLTLDGFRIVYRDSRKAALWAHNLRALLLLVLAIAPWVLAADLIVFGKQLRNWMTRHLPQPAIVSALWYLLCLLVALALVLLVLSVIYRVGRPAGAGGLTDVWPGAVLALLLWWLVSFALGVYVRHVPYSVIYGGLAVAIGLMLWMQLTALIVLIGAAFNAQRAGA